MIPCSRIWQRVPGQLDSDDLGERAVILKGQNLEFGLQTLQYEGNTLPQNVGIQLPTDTASYPYRMESSGTPLR
jgi:hypothetical protein